MAPTLDTAPLSLVHNASPSPHLYSPLSVWVRLSAKVPTLTQSQGDWMFTCSCRAVLCPSLPTQVTKPEPSLTHALPIVTIRAHESWEGPGHLHKKAHVWI